jgi:transposase-like protein
MSKPSARRKFSTDQKAAILRRHLVDKVAVSDLCEEYKIQPSLFYLWQRQAMEHLSAAFETSGRARRPEEGREAELERENEALRAKLTKKDRVIAEISAEYVQLKNELGEP